MTRRSPQSTDAAPHNGEVRVAQINRKVLWITVAVAATVVALSFVSLVVHGLVLSGKW